MMQWSTLKTNNGWNKKIPDLNVMYIQCPFVRMQRAAGMKESLEAWNKVTTIVDHDVLAERTAERTKKDEKSPLST